MVQIVGLIGGATLAVQTVVLGASLFQKAARPPPDPAAFGEGDRPPGPPGGPLRPGQVQIITPGASGSGTQGFDPITTTPPLSKCPGTLEQAQ